MMPSPRLSALVALFLGLLLTGPLVVAQDEAVRITGSAIVAPLIQALIEEADAGVELTSETTGSRTGLAMLCAGDAALSTSTQPIDEDSLQTCRGNDISLVELTLGHNILALIVHPETAEVVRCLDEAQLASIFAPSASGSTTTWGELQDGAPADLELTVLLPAELTATYSLLDALVSGEGLRDDGQTTTNAVAEVETTPGAVAATRLEQARSATVLSISTEGSEGCRAPSAETVEDGLYPAANPLLLYTNAASVDDLGVAALLEFVTGDAAADVVRSVGFTAVSEAVARDNRERLRAAQQGEAAPLLAGDFTMPDIISGALRIGGSGTTFSFVNGTLEALQAVNPGLSTTIVHLGAAAGFRDLCAGALDLVFTDRLPDGEERALCGESNIEADFLALGSRGLVLLASENGPAPACLGAGELGAIWRAESAGSIMNWQDLDESYPDETMVLFAPRAGDPDMDLVLSVAEAGLVGRADVELSNDPLYRAAATANVPGALTFMSQLEYEMVLANGQEGIRSVSLDVGDGCVSASAESIGDGSWPLSQTKWLAANRSRLTLPQVQAFLWYLTGGDNLPNWQAADYLDVRPATLNALQAKLRALFDEATLAALARLNESEPADDETAGEESG